MKIDLQHCTALSRLNAVNWRELNKRVDKVNVVISGIPTTNLEGTNKPVHAAARFVCDSVGPREYGSTAQCLPPWRVRLSNKLSVFWRELSQLVALGGILFLNERTVAHLTRKFNLAEVDVNTVIEVLKQKVTAFARRICRYDNRTLQYRQKQLFRMDAKKVLYARVTDMDVPEPGAALDFWKALWEKPAIHNAAADWLRSIEAGLCSLTGQSNLRITLLHVQTSLNRMHIIGEPLEMILYICFGGKSCVQYILAYLINLQELLDGSIPEWLVMGRTTLIQKDNKRPVPSIYRPITCLPTI